MIIVKRYNIIALIDRKKDFNDITILLVIRIKGYLKIEYKLNVEKERIKRVELYIKYDILKVSTFHVVDSNREYITLERK